MSEFSFDQLETADLVVDATYRGGTAGNTGDDPLCKLMPCGNQGGFRFCGSVTKGEVRMCILYSALSDPDWPDRLNLENGIFTYFGDNKKPGHELHDTPRGGNGLIRDAFAALHADERQKIPPFFIFTKGGRGRDVVFRGLAAPGGLGLRQTDDLVAVWKSRNRERFQNYRANFTVLSTAVISHEWIDELRSGDTLGTHCPAEWREFVERGKYVPLMAIPSVLHRKTTEQLPTAPDEVAMLNAIVRFFKSHVDKEYAFERCAAELFRMMDTNVTRIETTQFIRDGGRDAVGSYRIGTDDTFVEVEFALEAKCKTPSPTNSSGVKETSRLISRLLHRQFGVFVTTSCVGLQAYKEIVEDRHPVVVLAGQDIVGILKDKGISTPEMVREWLATHFG